MLYTCTCTRSSRTLYKYADPRDVHVSVIYRIGSESGEPPHVLSIDRHKQASNKARLNFLNYIKFCFPYKTA